MPDIYVFAFVEDAPSQAALNQMIHYVNSGRQEKFCLNSSPVITGGFGNMKKTATRFFNAAQRGIWSIFVTDLDRKSSPLELCRDWFDLPCFAMLPRSMIFRVAVHEIESWLIADKTGIASFLGISDSVFPNAPDDLDDPKKVLLDTIRSKCRKKIYRDMLPKMGQSIGIEYNHMLKKYIQSHQMLNKVDTLLMVMILN